MKKIKKNYWIFMVVFIALAACQPTTPKAEVVTEEPLQMVTPNVPAGMLFYDGCTHMMPYPEELQEDGTGMLFEYPENPAIQVYISTRRRFESEADADLTAIAENIATEYNVSDLITFSPQSVMDFTGKENPALLGNGETGTSHVQILVTLIPDYFLMDMVKGDVIYYLVAQAPTEAWGEWEEKFQQMIDQFTPKECGGV